MDSETGRGGGDGGRRGRKKGKARKGNGWASRKKNSASTSKDPPTPSTEAPPAVTYTPIYRPAAPAQAPAPAPPPQHRPSALEILTKQSKKRGVVKSSSSLGGNRPRKNVASLASAPGPPAPPVPTKLKRLQKKTPQMVTQTPKNTTPSGPQAPAGARRTRVMQVPTRQNPVLSLDMPDLSQLSTSPIFAQIQDDLETAPPLGPRPLHKQGPFPPARVTDFSSQGYPAQRQRLQAYHGGGGVSGSGADVVGGIEDLLQVPVPYPRQRDMVLSSGPAGPLPYQQTDYDLLPPFQNIFASVPASVLSSSSGGKGHHRHPGGARQLDINAINPNQLVCLEVPTSAFEEIAASHAENAAEEPPPPPPQNEEISYLRMIRQQEEDAKRKEQRRVMLVTSERLKNILKLPKAHKWVIYEWFYSDIDRALFGGENDFEICLRECFPNLKARKMTRVEWCRIRQTMGKPRRSSCKFFEEERDHLAVRREKIRMIQRRVKMAEWGDVRKLLPEEIPMMLTIGTCVTARVRKPQDGIFQGTVEGVDPSNNTYRICFGRDGLGVHSIPDYEVRAQVPPDTISTMSFCLKIPRHGSCSEAFKWKFRNAAKVQDKMKEELPKSPFPVDSMLGGFPVRCLELIVRQSKLLKAKKSKLGELRELNVEAEKMRTYGRPYPEDYKKRYAKCIVELEEMNKAHEKISEVIKVYMEEIAEDAIQDGSEGAGASGGGGGPPGQGTSSSSAGKMVYPEKVKENADKEAKDIVTTYNLPGRVQSGKMTDLIQKMASLMLQVKALGTQTGERKQFELQSIRETVAEMKKDLEGENLKTFENKVDIPLSRIMAGLCINPKVDEDK